MRMIFLTCCLALFGATAAAHPPAEQAGKAYYLANEGVMVEDGQTKILFDPIFTQGFNRYLLLPEEMKAALMEGRAPYDGVSAVFISHAHGDHFDAAGMIDYLLANQGAALVAPQQAIDQLKEHSSFNPAWEGGRILAVDLDYDHAPEMFHVDYGALISEGPEDRGVDYRPVVEAFRIPHAGGPGRRDVQNIVYRVTLQSGATVMHLGDATPQAEFYASHAAPLSSRITDMAFIPYWILGPSMGPDKAKDILHALALVGVHVPENPPVPLVRSGLDIFTTPGEMRQITISSPTRTGE